MDRFGVWVSVLMGRSAPVVVRMERSSCGNSARAVTACGKIEEVSLNEGHGYKALEVDPWSTAPPFSFIVLVFYRAYQEDGVCFSSSGNHTVCVLRDVHIIAWVAILCSTFTTTKL